MSRGDAVSTVTADRGAVRSALEAASGRVAGLVRRLPDPQVKIRSSDWTVGEASHHVAFAARLLASLAQGAEIPHGDGSKQGIAAANAASLRETPQQGAHQLAETIVEQTRALLEATTDVSPERTVVSPMGPMDLDTLTSYALTHLLQHGSAIARAVGRPVPVEPSDVPLTLPFITYSMPRVIRGDAARSLRACFELRVRGGPRFALAFDRGSLTLSPTPTRAVDCYISAEPVALFLVGMGVVGQWGPIATGRILAWGRKPWLAFRFVELFDVP
ncbi:MAG: maleylpyruvate isomerase N-terminal domain-containing protein [Actinomycetota bacterium]